VAVGSVTPLWLAPIVAEPTASSQLHKEGELYYASATSSLWVCVAGGTPGTWRKLAGSNTTGSLQLLSTPVRVYDSRPAFAPATGPKSPLVGGSPRTIDLKLNRGPPACWST
jgi:hypothetical protein